MKPLVSVVICFLNEERFLTEAVESVLQQDYNDWELLLVDDGSTDKSTDISKNFVSEYPDKIYYFDHPGHINKGLSASRNWGIKNARGVFVAILDADDFWLPVKLSTQVNIFGQNPAAAMICEASEYWYSWDNPEKNDVEIQIGVSQDHLYVPVELITQLYPLGIGAAPCPSGIMAKKSVLDLHKGFEESFTGRYQLYEDQAFLSKMYLNENVYISSACHNRYRQRVGSLVQAVNEEGYYHFVRKYFLEWLENYLNINQINNRTVRKLLEKQLQRYRQPIIYNLTQQISRSWKKLTRKK